MEKQKKIQARWIIAVGGSKGGVGKSTVTSVLAQGFAKRGLGVGVLDADLYGPSMRIMLGSGSCPLFMQGNVITPALCHGIKVVGLSYFQVKLPNVYRAPVANELIEKMLFSVEWGELDILLIDLPPGTGDIPLTIMQKISLSGALLVSGPQIVSLSDVAKFAGLCKSLNIPVLGLVENMAYFLDSVSQELFYPFGEGQCSTFCKDREIPFLGQIGIMQKLSDALDWGKNVFDCLTSTDSHSLLALCDNVYSGIQKSDTLSFTIEKMHRKVCLLTILKRKIPLLAKDIQKKCPCALCLRNSLVGDPEILKVKKIGVSGVQFSFSSGCSKGIYPTGLLMQIGGVS